jgi:hypothetical protein
VNVLGTEFALCRTAAGDGFVNSFVRVICESASGFEPELEATVESAMMLSLILYEDPKDSDLSDPGCWFLAKIMFMLWERADLLGRRSISSRE